MDEILAAILGEIAGFFLEAFLELIAAAVLGLAYRALSASFTSLAEAVKENRLLASVMYALLGALAGTLSLLFLPILSSGIPPGFMVLASWSVH